MSLSGHSTPVDCVRFSITEEQVCAGSAAGALKIWDLESAKMLRTLTGHRASIRCVDFHPYGDFLASGSSDSGIKLWDIRKKGCIFGYKGHNGTVNSLKFSPDGQWIASGGDDNFVKVWDIRVGKVLTEFSHHGPVTDVEFHPHEFLLASGSMDRTVKFWELETFSLISSSIPDVPPVRCITFHPSGACLFSASSECLRVHGWEPPETHDSVSTTWAKIQDIAISHEQLVGVTMSMTNVSIFVVDLKRISPIGNNSKQMRTTLHSAGHTSLRKNFSTERSSEFAESLHAMKASEDSDSLPTDPEDDNISYVGTNFKEAFRPHRDLARTPPPEEFYPPPDDEPSISTSIESVSPGCGRNNSKFRYVTNRNHSKVRVADTSPRRASVPNFVPGQPTQNNHLNANVGLSARSRSPEYLSSRQSSLSDDSGPYSGRSTDTNKSSCAESLYSQNVPNTIKREPMKTSQSESCLQLPSPGELTHQPSLPQIRDKSTPQQSYSQQAPLPPLQPLLRSPDKPLAQCQVKPMPKVSPRDVGISNDYEKKTDFSNAQIDDFVPTPSGVGPVGLAIDDFLPKASMTMKGGVAYPELNETETFTNLAQGHQSFLAVLISRQRNLRIVYNVWQTKDVKAAVDTAMGLNDQFVLVDVLTVLTQRPAMWNLDLCVAVLPCVSQLIQSKFESSIVAGLSVLRLILKNFGNVIKANIDGPIQTVGVDISREERYNKSMECYRQLVTIRAFTLKRQTVPGKIGHTFRELHILLGTLD
ncbi:hypothetical protein Fcan01_18512 [Folsomia candida]|uniref:Katanin p80 WD40 repeat-containing subunit B1 n=2 Tax=Folsomia candida TaxID=158441 RepID=A0A226DMM8_FOLCA|nr:hypothetical protein Fcan01_18512 [Folsomia candida]